MANDMDMYDEGTDLDQESNVRDGADKAEKDSEYESFLAPKSAFKGDISPGTIHRVKIERALDSELQLRCLGVSKDEPESDDNSAEESDELYQ